MIYIIVAGCWHLLSNVLLKRYGGNLEESLDLDTIKDWSFVILMGGILHLGLRHLLRQWEQETELRKETENNLRRTERALKTISACNGVLVRATSEAVLLTEICREVVEKGGYRLAWVGFAENNEEKSITIAARAGHDAGYLEKANISWSEEVERGRGPVGTAIRTGEIVVCNDFLTDPQAMPWRQAAAQHGFASNIVLPLRHAEKSFGVLTIYATEANAFNLTEVELLHELADDLGYGIQALRTKAEHLQAEEALHENESLLRSVMENTKEVIFVKDRECRFIYMNPAGYRLSGMTPEKLLGRSKADFHPNPAEARQFMVDDRRVMESTLTETIEETIGGADGTQHVFLTTKVARRDGQGNVIGLIGVAHDITERKRAEAALRESELKFRAIFNNNALATAIIEPDGTISMINDAYCQASGYTREETVGKNWNWVIIPEDLERLSEYNRRRLINPHDAPGQYEFRYCHKNGEIKECQIAVSLIQSSGQIVASMLDITDRRRAEEILRESEKKFSGIFHSSPVPVSLSTIQEGRYLDANDEFLKLFQRSREEVIGHTVFELNIWADLEQRAAIVAEIESHGSASNVEVEIRTKSGEIRSILWSVAAVFINGEKCWLGSCLDITERKRAEEQVHLQSAALTAAANAMMITDRHGKIDWVNPAFTRLTGYRADEAVGNNTRILKSGQHPPAFYSTLWATILTGNVWHGELVNRRKNGQLYTEDTTITPVRGANGQIAHFIAIKQDVTERHLLESQLRQSQKMEAIGQLAGGVAHDFNNILAALLMQTQLVEMIEDLPQEVVDGLEQIRAFTNRASDLTRQLLLFSRRQIMQPRNLDLNEVVTNLAKMLQRIIGEDVRLQLNLHPTPLMTRADPGMLEQVLLNLAVNARDAMPKGGQLRIDTTETNVAENAAGPEMVPGHYVCFSVSDTGTGIPPEILPKIFEPFFTTKEAGKGTGLGLATVFGIVKQHGGWITVDNRPGQGVTFQVYLPAGAMTVAETPKIPSQPKPRGGSETILLVEDESEVRNLIRKILKRHGYQVLEATNGIEALAVWREQRETVKLLVTDLVMPAGLSGQELARQLQAAQPNLKVIFISGYSAEIAGRELQLRGGERFIQKPFATDHLLETVRRSLDG